MPLGFGGIFNHTYFAPTSISGCIGWWRADSGITVSSGNVSVWADQSGNKNNATQPTTGNQPSYNISDTNFGGQPSLTFTGSTQNLAVTIPSTPTVGVFAVGINTASTGNATYGCNIIGQVSSLLLGLYPSGADWNTFAGAGNDPAPVTVGLSPFAVAHNFSSNAITIPTVFCVNNSNTLYLSPTTFEASTALSSFQLGNRGTLGGWSGNIAEIALYNTTLTIQEINMLFKYAGSRYNHPTWG